MSPPRGSFKVHSPEISKRRKDFLVVALVAAVLVGMTIFLTINLLDQSERSVDTIKQTHMEGPAGSRTQERESEADLSVKAEVEKNLNATKMSFAHYELTDQGIKHIAKISKLSELSLVDTRISDEGLKFLTDLPLTILNLSDTNITDAGMKYIGKLKMVHVLILSETDVSDKGLVELRPLTDLSDLHLTATQVTDRGMKELVEYHKSIWKLVLIHTNITDKGLRTLSKLPNLTNLHLDGTVITADGLKVFENTNLHKLALINCKINDADVAKIVKSLPGLLLIDLSRTQVTAAGLDHLSKLKTLQTLIINPSATISEKDLADFQRKLPSCKIVRSL